jgi:hypothetical protein
MKKKLEEITRIYFYRSAFDMDKGIREMEGLGWKVKGTEVIKGNYEMWKTCLLGIIFLPLALLGKGSDKYKVEYTGYTGKSKLPLESSIKSSPMTANDWAKVIIITALVIGGILFLMAICSSSS